MKVVHFKETGTVIITIIIISSFVRCNCCFAYVDSQPRKWTTIVLHETLIHLYKAKGWCSDKKSIGYEGLIFRIPHKIRNETKRRLRCTQFNDLSQQILKWAFPTTFPHSIPSRAHPYWLNNIVSAIHSPAVLLRIRRRMQKWVLKGIHIRIWGPDLKGAKVGSTIRRMPAEKTSST